MTNSLAKFWQCFEPDADENVHPDDKPNVRKYNSTKSCDHYTHVRLLPQPYLGDLECADIFAVYLNPGFNPADYEWEQRDDFRNARMATIKQERGRRVPFDFFDAAFAEHPGFCWWSHKMGATRTEALKSRFAVIELYPYHSRRFSAHGWQTTLPSFCATVHYIREELAPRAARAEICLIIVRGATRIGLSATTNMVVYGSGGRARGGYLTPVTEGGKAIARWIESHPTPPCAAA